MVGLSEKAKGKQRAIEPQAPEEPVPPTQRPLTIRFADGLPDLDLTLDAKDTVRRVKQQIREGCPQVDKRRLRLIYSGRILADNIVLFDWLSSLEARQQKTSDIGKEKAKEDVVFGSAATGGPPPTWLHCSVGAELIGDSEEDEKRIQDSQIKPLRGFDRLAAAGFSEDDIANFRQTFHNQSSGDYLDTEPLGEDEDYDEHARALEEQWIDSLDDGNVSSITQASPSRTILQGLIVGFFFPFMPFFFLRDPTPAVFWDDGRAQERTSSVIFSKRMQMALVLGFIVNLIFGVWRYLLGS
ncbi:hypothetical protein EW145_g3495 [Phellinidium pouzarii]|uniref:Ubiquitin-like domain-containing protein n=1 Tax=Phellinidium pouzarii TaxID=167371 RepID=A0A4S4L786_9AGAM|nr:hypothetical protein EW145_g3495 [Phellinidium pouzarii]